MLDAEISAFLVEADHVARHTVVQKVVLRRGIVEGPETFEHVFITVIVSVAVTLRISWIIAVKRGVIAACWMTYRFVPVANVLQAFIHRYTCSEGPHTSQRP